MRLALGIEYNGADYHGWQIQKDVHCPTIALALEKAASLVANHPIKVYCAGRTDKGVHATGQVIHFDTTATRPLHSWLQGINFYLPDNIAVQWVVPVNEHFHARFSATSRRYVYIIDNHTSPPAILHERVSWYRYPLNELWMQAAALCLLGEHDFSSYRAQGCQAKSPIRRIEHFEVQRRKNYVILDVKANAFLHHMIRNMVGVLTAIGEGQQPVKWAREVLEAKNRQVAGVTATPFGLYLIHVEYPEEYGLPSECIKPFLL